MYHYILLTIQEGDFFILIGNSRLNYSVLVLNSTYKRRFLKLIISNIAFWIFSEMTIPIAIFHFPVQFYFQLPFQFSSQFPVTVRLQYHPVEFRHLYGE